MTSPTETAWIQTASRPSGLVGEAQGEAFAEMDAVLLEDLHPERVIGQIEGEGDGQGERIDQVHGP